MRANLKTFIKKSVTTNKMATLLILYVLTVVWFKGEVYTFVEKYSFTETFVSLLIVPCVFVMLFYVNNNKKQSQSPETFTVMKQLTENQQFLLQKNVPTSQLAFVNQVLLISLGLLYEVLNSIQSESKAGWTLFDEKFSKIIQLFKCLKQRPEFANNTILSRSRNNALTIFAVYRLLFQDVLDRAIGQGVLENNIDPWILLKRIPPKVSVYLGSQSWRLYEFKTVIYGDLSQLTLNADIKAALIDLCRDNKGQVAALHSPDVEGESINAKSCAPETVSATKMEDNTIPLQCGDDHSSQENPIQTAPSEKDVSDDNVFMKKFLSWLQRQLIRHPINQGERFFMDFLQYGKDYLFISDIGLSDFVKKSHLEMDALKTKLQHIRMAEDAIFYLEREGKKSVALLGIRINFGVDVTDSLIGKIVR